MWSQTEKMPPEDYRWSRELTEVKLVSHPVGRCALSVGIGGTNGFFFATPFFLVKQLGLVSLRQNQHSPADSEDFSGMSLAETASARPLPSTGLGLGWNLLFSFISVVTESCIYFWPGTRLLPGQRMDSCGLLYS